MGASRASCTSRRLLPTFNAWTGASLFQCGKFRRGGSFISCGKECRARLGQVGMAAGVIAHSFFGQSLSDSQLSRATIIMPNRVKCQFGRSFQKFLPPEGQLSKTLRKQNSQTGWKNGVPFLTAGKLQRTSDRQSLPDWRVLQEKGTVSGTGTGLHKGAARMSRIRLSQPQGAKRRDGQATAATVTRCCSRGDDAVRNRVDPLRWNGR